MDLKPLFLGLLWSVFTIKCVLSTSGDFCMNLKKSVPKIQRGEIQFHTNGDNMTLYCEFNDFGGYTFYPQSDVMEVPDKEVDHVLLRHIRSDNSQFETRMEQITEMQNILLSVQYNKANNYTQPTNKNSMGPFLFLGFLPANAITEGSINGYRSNGTNFTFTNCDSNPNSYLAFFVKEANSGLNQIPTVNYPLMRNWVDQSSPVASWSYLPQSYFMQFEMHMGGCGGYVVNGYVNLHDIKGAAIGIPFYDTTPSASTAEATPKTTTQTPTTKATTTTTNKAVSKSTEPVLNAAILKRLKDIVAKLTVDKKNLTSHRSKKISATDRRLSATLTGMVGVVVLVAVMSAIVIPDVIALLRAIVQKIRAK